MRQILFIIGEVWAVLLFLSLFAYGAAASPSSEYFSDSSGQSEELILEDLFNITVSTTSKTEEKLSDAPGVISVITPEEMKRFGARTLKDVLMRLPGTNMTTTYISDMSCVSIRGDQINAAANHILLLINGRPVREAQEGGIKGEVYETFPAASIERIEIIRGPGSVLYGSTAFSGVINVITKRADENKTVLSLKGGAPGQINSTVDLGYRLPTPIGDIGFVWGGQYKYSKPWNVRFQARDTVFRDFSIPDEGFGVYGELSFKGFKYMTSLNQWKNYFAFQKYIPPPPSGPIAGRHAYGELQWKKWFNDVGYAHKFSDLWDMTINATYTQSWLKVDSFPAPHRNTYDLTCEWTTFIHPMKEMNIIIGVLGTRVKGKEESGLPLAVTLDTMQNSFSGYIQADYHLLSQFKMIAGIQANKAEGIDLDFNPRIGVIWSPEEIVNVKALYSSAFRAPSMMELYLKHPTLKGTPNLKPEKINTLDFGVNIQTDRVLLGLNNFYSRITNTIYPKQIMPPPNLYQNYDIPTIFVGMEVEYKIFITKEFMLTGSGLFQKNSTGDSAGNMMPVPEASAKGGISYSANGFTASVFNIYEHDLHPRYNAAYNKTRKAFDLLNANLNYEINRLFKLKRPVISIDIEGYNLLNQEIWLPNTGLLKEYTVPKIKGISYYAGISIGL